MHPNDSASSSAPPPSIGPYRILKLLGEGGMGLVYEAEQRSEVRRRVALKVMKPGLDADQVLARFEAERQALAVMQHPGIAKLFDAGVTEDGRPYFVMELVDGEPLTEFADGNKLPVADRLHLFVSVCHAVQHAHLKGVVHRDLKPSNVLVTARDDVPTPKIIDFGIAKATGEPLTERTLVTQFGQALGTPAYMSPEQAGATGLDVDSRTDVYSLGVTLYELLVGRLPIDPREVGPQGFLAQLVMKETDPPTPSTRFSTLDRDFQAAIARFRQTDPGSLKNEVHGDLDWIVMKAMDKDRERRYETPNALAADLERHLAHEAVLARPPSATYRAGKFVRRHRWGVGVVAALVALVMGFSVVTSVQASRIARARDRAQVEAANAEAVLDFMTETLSAPDPREGLGLDVTVMEAIDAAVEDISEKVGGVLNAEAAARAVIGNLYRQYGRYSEARDQLETSLELRRQIHGPSHPEVAESLDLLADLELAEGHYQSADTLFRTAVEMRRHELGPSDYWVAESLVGLGITQKELEQYDEAEDSFLEALDIRERTGADSLRISELWDNLATVYYHQGEVDLAEPLYRRTLAIRRTELGSESILVAQSLNNLAPTLEALEKYTEAESLYREAMNIYRESLGPESGHLANTMVNLAILLEEELNEYDEAELLYEGAIRIGESLYSDENVIVAGWRRAYGGFLCVVQEKSADGATQIRAALPILEREYSPGSEQVVAARSMLGYCLTDLGEFEQAEEQLLRTLYDSQSGLGPDHSRTQQARERLVRLYEAWERPEQADEYRSETEAQSSEP